ncbi:MAG: protein kinase [Myxococcota bacterium]
MNQPTSLAEGRYLLVAKLGEGGMATVYRAFDQRLQVWRAVKILSPDYADKKKIARRFEAEAQTMALLEHRNIVRVYDVGREGNVAYIVMELLLGGCLVDWLEHHGPMPPRMAVEATMQTCEGLAAAHDKGVIHRDIKPHNVLVTADGVCRVTDFGIARVGDADASMTKTGSVMGTWGYMAPEQRTNAKGVDVRADVYAVGATLYSLLTDRMPMDLFAADRDSSILEGVHELLLPILVKATEYNREDRHATVLELRDELKAVYDQLPEIPDGTSPLAVDAPPNPAPPDPTQYESPKPVAKGGAAGETLLPGEMARASTDPSPTILPDGEGTEMSPGELATSAGSMTLPPEEVAVTQPGAITRQTRPVFDPRSLAPTRIEEMTSAPIPAAENSPTNTGGGTVATARAALFGATAFVWLIGGLVLIVFLLVVLWQVVLRDPNANTGVVQPVPTVEPKPLPDPVPDANPVDPKPGPDSPQPVKPDPVKPDPVKPDPVKPDPVRPNPVVPTPPPVPDPVPAKACVEGVPADFTSSQKIKFTMTWCGSGPLDKNLRLVVHYRKAGPGRYTTKEMTVYNGKWIASLESNPEYAAGVEYYIDGWGGSYGSASTPKIVVQ